MRNRSTAASRLSFFAALLVLVAAPGSTAAQSSLDASQAQAFLGDWVMTLDTDFGVMTFALEIEDMMGKVGARMGSPDLGGMQEITNITRTGEALRMVYDVDMEGQLIDVALSLEPDGDDLAATVEAAGGQFVTTTVASRAAS